MVAGGGKDGRVYITVHKTRTTSHDQRIMGDMVRVACLMGRRCCWRQQQEAGRTDFPFSSADYWEDAIKDLSREPMVGLDFKNYGMLKAVGEKI